MIYLEKDNLGEILSDGITLVEYYAPWCAHCKQMDEILKSLETKYKIIKVDIDKFNLIAYENRIMSIPTIKIYKNKELVNEIIGVHQKDEIENIINEII